ncbi:MAG: hypothetical protein JWP75_1273 [Frondihabitans sp.]|nr:hypothetical protein [Frondihabitans sp.]
MGVFDRLKGMKDPVEGQFHIVACSANSGGAVYENCAFDGVVSGPGIVPTSVHHSSLATPTAKWPTPGVTLPVRVDRQNPERLKILWDKVPSTRDTARKLAQAQAQQMAAAQGGATVPPTGQSPQPGMPDLAALPPQYQSMMSDLIARAQAAGATVSTSSETTVVGAGGRAVPGAPGGGLTPEETASVLAGGAAGLGMQPTTATVLAAHEIPIPAGTPGAAPGGVWDVTLDVAGAPGYTTVMRIGFSSPEKQRTIAAVGRQLPVLADPTRHDRIAVDTTRL